MLVLVTNAGVRNTAAVAILDEVTTLWFECGAVYRNFER